MITQGKWDTLYVLLNLARSGSPDNAAVRLRLPLPLRLNQPTAKQGPDLHAHGCRSCKSSSKILEAEALLPFLLS